MAFLAQSFDRTQQSASHVASTSPFDALQLRQAPHLSKYLRQPASQSQSSQSLSRPSPANPSCLMVHRTQVRSRHSGPSYFRHLHRQRSPASSRGSLSYRVASVFTRPSPSTPTTQVLTSSTSGLPSNTTTPPLHNSSFSSSVLPTPNLLRRIVILTF